MLSLRGLRTSGLILTMLAGFAWSTVAAHAQAALLMEEPYGFFGTVNPTGHTALYFARICAETPVRLRRCEPGELGSVISKYSGIAGYDWVAMPVIPYLYSVEDASEAPEHVDKAIVRRLRNRYHEDHMGALGEGVFEGNMVRSGWTQLVGVAFERRIYAFRFATTDEQDDAVIARLNNQPNRSNFNFFYNNCADFARMVLNLYFPHTFRRTLFPDAAMTTPKEIAYKLARYARKHPDIDLTVYAIPQVPGYRRMSHANKSVSASLMTTGYAVPIALLNPYLAGGLFLDYLTRGRFPAVPQHPPMLTPEHLCVLTSCPAAGQNPDQSAAQLSHALPADTMTDPFLKEIQITHE